LLRNIIFVDTSAIYAICNKDDKHHQEAVNFVSSLPPYLKLVISNYVFVETWCLLNAHLSWKAALAFYDDVLSKAFHLIDIQEADILASRKIMDKYADQSFSLVDATSFALMEHLGITRAFSFDSHFRIYRKPDRNHFEILP
jgi:predicted nucleic acid-binding protein